MPTPQAIATAARLRASNIAQLAEQARKLATSRDHFVSHLSSNLDSFNSGIESRDAGMSFARLPHERMSSPTLDEPSGRTGVVFARVGGPGLDYAIPAHRQAVDSIVQAAIDSSGSADSAIPALRGAGIGWVNNWNSIGAADELHALSPDAIDVRHVLPLQSGRQYRFPPPDSSLGIVVDRDWRRAATLGPGQPEIRSQPATLDGLRGAQ